MEDNKKVRKGKCRNYGECEKASSQEIIEIEEGKPFECPECGAPLMPLDGPKDQKGTKKKKPKVNPIVYVGGVCILLVIVIVAWLLLRPSTPKVDTADPKKIAKVVTEPAPDSGKVDTVVNVDPVPQVTNVEEPKNPRPVEPKPVAPKHSLSYGTWTGGWKNGKPHGTGTLTYTQATLIDSRDPKGRVAQPEEYVIGEWDNGHLVQGRWFKNDGSKEQINIGKAG